MILPFHSPAELSDGPAPSIPPVGARFGAADVSVELYSSAQLPTRFGCFTVCVFRSSLDDKEHVALVRGEVRGRERVPVRMHSECLTGDVLGSLRCDCRGQLEMALATVGESDAGVLLYLRQEGRGIGLGNKIRAYALQEQGLDTVDANRHLGFDDDLRDYRVAALMLRAFAPASVELYTNNPRKLRGLEQMGIAVSRRVPILTRPTAHNERYLETKARRSGHLLPID